MVISDSKNRKGVLNLEPDKIIEITSEKYGVNGRIEDYAH